jgi:hypothetical protein
MAAADLKRAVEQATKYVRKVGAPQHHFQDGSVGRIHSLKVETEINHQESPSATNYWKDRAFDAALGTVIAAEFSQLAEKALALMAREYAMARVAEKQSLLRQLAEIEALEQELS